MYGEGNTAFKARPIEGASYNHKLAFQRKIAESFSGLATYMTKMDRLSMALSTVPFALVVDDDPMIIMDTTSILEDAGFRYFEAMNGDEAKAVLAEHWESIILLFSDVDMPGETNGFALARHVAERWPAIEIVIASGHVMPNDNEMPEKATFIRKPFNKNMVHEHLRRTLPDNKKPQPLLKAI